MKHKQYINVGYLNCRAAGQSTGGRRWLAGQQLDIKFCRTRIEGNFG